MGKRKVTGEYNDFLDGEKLRDNAEVRTSLQGKPSLHRHASPPNSTGPSSKGRSKKGKGDLKKPQLTHFLCLPLINTKSRPQLEASLATLKQDLEHAGLVPLKAVRPVGTLHLTLGVMSLDEDQLEAATQYLQKLDVQKILYLITTQATAERAAEDGTVSENLNAYAMPDTGALSIELKGLVPMQAPHKTSILYAEPTDSTQRLLPFAEKLKHYFTEEGFLVQDKRSLRLHATIVNTIYAKPKGRHGRSRGAEAGDVSINEATQPLNSVNEMDRHNDGISTARSTQDETEELTTAPPDPSTAETKTGLKLDGADGHGPDAGSWLRFDARYLIDRYSEVKWAENIRVDRVQICKMGAKKILGEQGEIMAEEYEVVSEKAIGA